MPVLPVSPGQIFEGKYLIDKVIGEGGMGVVVLAQHLELDQPVAIKFLLDSLTDNLDGAERFRREARAAAKIQSDHVARVFDVGVMPTGERYMVMEYLRGHDLADELTTRGRLPIAYGVRLMLEVLEAMSEAHAAGIVHRDLKPGNVFLAARPDGRIRVKVLDFGISKAIGSGSQSNLSLTKTSSWMGSPLYTAPEQMQSARDVDTRADIWSFGAIFYEVLTGQPPYVAESLPQLCSLLLSQDPGPLRDLRPEIPTDVEDLVLRCLRRPRELRYQDAAELLGALELCHAKLSSGGDHESLPDSLAPIASRLAPLPPSRPDARPDMATASTLLAGPGAQHAATARAVAPSTTGAWTSNSRPAPPGPPSATEAPTNRRSTRARLGVALALAALAASAAAGAAWLFLRPQAHPDALAPHQGPVANAPAPTQSEAPAHKTAPVEPTHAAVPAAAPTPTPAVPAEAAPAPAIPPPVHALPAAPPNQASGPRVPRGRPAPAAPASGEAQPTTTATPTTATPPSRPRPSDDFERFGGRR